jgi:Flp pilus assembly protein TadG
MTKRANIKNERGQTMVEFALVVPLLFLVLFGIIQFGITFKNYVALTDAVRSGARVGAVSRLAVDPVATTTNQVNTAAGDLATSGMKVKVTSDWIHGDDVVVSATYPYSISLFGVVVASGTLTSTTTERVE